MSIVPACAATCLGFKLTLAQGKATAGSEKAAEDTDPAGDQNVPATEVAEAVATGRRKCWSRPGARLPNLPGLYSLLDNLATKLIVLRRRIRQRAIF